MFNKVILVGNLTRDVELRYLPSQSAFAKIGLATNRRYKKQDGSQGEEVCFVDVNLFGRSAEIANQYLKKGSQILVEGRLVLESWIDQNGQKHSKHSITAESMQMLGGGGNKADASNVSASANNESVAYSNGPSVAYEETQPQTQKTKNQNNPTIDIDNEEIPF